VFRDKLPLRFRVYSGVAKVKCKFIFFKIGEGDCGE